MPWRLVRSLGPVRYAANDITFCMCVRRPHATRFCSCSQPAPWGGSRASREASSRAVPLSAEVLRPRLRFCVPISCPSRPRLPVGVVVRVLVAENSETLPDRSHPAPAGRPACPGRLKPPTPSGSGRSSGAPIPPPAPRAEPGPRSGSRHPVRLASMLFT